MTYSSAPAAGDTGYYTGGVGKSREEYYLGAVKGGNPHGLWGGKLAEDLGLTGTVEAETMAHVYDTLTGPNGERLGQGIPSRGAYAPIEVQVAAWIEEHPRATPEEASAARIEIEGKARTGPSTAVDLTYSVPKSWTLVITGYDRAAQEAEARGDTAAAEYLYGRARELEGDIVDAHRATMDYLESSGVLTTRAGWHTSGRDGADRYSPVVGLAYTTFLQRDSQEGDPQIHIHTPILLRARAEDGKIRRPEGLVARGGSGVKFAASAMTDRTVAELWAARGLPMEMRPDGIAAECSLVPAEMVETFSKRTHGQITPYMAELREEYRERYGVEPGAHTLARMHRHAKTATRGRKVGEDLTRAEKLDHYEVQARRESGHSLVGLAEAAERAMAKGPVKAAAWSPQAVKEEAVARVSAERSTWTREALAAAVHASMPANAFTNLPVDQIAAAVQRVEWELADEILASDEAVQVAGLGIEAKAIEEAERYGSPLNVRYAARGTLAAEEAVRRAAREVGGVAMTRGQAERWLEANAPTIGPDQREAFLGVATSRSFLTVIEAPAGTGKSFVVGRLAAAHEATHGAGTVIGTAIGSRQAEVLAEEGLRNTANTTVLLNALDRGQIRLGPASVLFVDEASQLTTDHGRRLLDHYRAAGGRVTLIQDPAQRQAVGAGGVPALLENHAETFRLADVRRMTEEWEKAASLRLRDGDTSVLAEYDRRGRLVGAQSQQEAHQAAARGVFVDMTLGLDSVAITGSNAEAGQVAALIRGHLVDAGRVSAEGVDLADKRGGGVAGRGDRIQIRNNDHTLGVLNRQVWHVEETLDDGGLRVVHPKTGEVKDLPGEYVARDVSLAYAGTVDAVQGVTVDRGHALAPDYVAMTRGKESNVAYLVCPENEHGERPSARSVMAEALTDDRELPALVEAERDQLARESVSFVIGRYEDVTQQACTDRLVRHLDMLAVDGTLSEEDRARFTAGDGCEHLSRRLRSLEQAGHNPEAVLRKAIESGPLPATGSAGRVLSYRLGEAHGAPEPVSMAAPADVDEVYATRLANLSAMVEERTATLGAELAENTPAWALRDLGPVPEDLDERADWQRRAGEVAAAREAGRWTDEGRALPAAPSVYNTERRALWGRGYEALGRPEEARAEAVLSDGALRVRVSAWERQEALAPRYAEADQQAAHHRAAQARERAALAVDEAERDSAEADRAMWESVAHGLDRQAEAREAYMDAHRATKDNADRAAAEAERRGLPAVDEAEDLTTAAEWLDLEVTARVEDDTHRQITETDVDEHQTQGDHVAAVEAAEDDYLSSYQPPAYEDGLSDEEVAGLDAYTDATMDRLSDWSSLSYDEPAADTGWELEY